MSVRDLFTTAAPDVAVEVDRTHVAAARLSLRGSQAVITAHASEPLPAGLVVPGLAAANVTDVPALAQAIRSAVSQLGGSKPTRVALVVPDTVAKVSLLRLDTVPARAADLQEIVKWQVKKTAPFPMENAIVSIAPGALGADGAAPPHGARSARSGPREFVVSVARADVIHQYEQACVMAGLHAGLVDLATFSVLNGILASASAPVGDWLLVHVTDTYLTIAVMRDQAMLFFRNRSEEGEGTLADMIHQTAMYYEDRLHGTGFARVMISGAGRLPSGAESVRRDLEQRLKLGVEAVDPRTAAALQDRIAASPELLDVLAPLVGMLLRERKAA
jgi:Tfp pilus assembly PilM family ATPase